MAKKGEGKQGEKLKTGENRGNKKKFGNFELLFVNPKGVGRSGARAEKN